MNDSPDACTVRRQRRELRHERAALVEQILGRVAPHPRLEHAQLLGVGAPVIFIAIGLSAIALFVILLYCLSYADQWYVNVFSFLEDRRLAHWLNRLVNFTLAFALLGMIWWAADVIVGEIAHAQL